jgi:hypothetical protein
MIGITNTHITRWDDDVIFKNQARGTEDKGKKEFVNVCFHYIHYDTFP